MKTVSLVKSRNCCLRHSRCILEIPKLFFDVLISYLTQNSQISFPSSYNWTFKPFLCMQNPFLNKFYELLPGGTFEVLWSPRNSFSLYQIFQFMTKSSIFVHFLPFSPQNAIIHVQFQSDFSLIRQIPRVTTPKQDKETFLSSNIFRQNALGIQAPNKCFHIF